MMMGPRQMAGASRSTRKPSDISRTPCASSGWILPGEHRRLAGRAEHARNVGPVDVGVHHADPVTRLREGDGDVGRDGGLSHPTLARRHGDDAAEIGLRRRDGGRARWDRNGGGGWTVRGARRPRRVGHGDADSLAPDPLDSLDGGAGLANERGGIVGGEQKGEAHVSLGADREIADHARGEDVVLEPGVADGGKRRRDPRLEGFRH